MISNLIISPPISDILNGLIFNINPLFLKILSKLSFLYSCIFIDVKLLNINSWELLFCKSTFIFNFGIGFINA